MVWSLLIRRPTHQADHRSRLTTPVALEAITVSVSDLAIGVILLIVGLILYAVNARFPKPADLAVLIVGIIMAVIGVVLIVLAFF